MQIEYLKIDDLNPYDKNSRTHTKEQIKKVAASIKEFGFTNPILIRDDGTILAGHGRVEAAKLLDMKAIPCIRLSHLTPAQARAYVIADNALAELAGWDDGILASEVAALKDEGFNLDILGLQDLDSIIAGLAGSQGLTDEDAVPDVPEVPITRMGDLWLLGPHRVLCGDATKKEDVDRLMDGKKADMVFTDPPYNVDYTGKTKASLKMKNDKMTPIAFNALLLNSFQIASSVCLSGTPIYVCYADIESVTFRTALLKTGWLVKSGLIWVKNCLVLGHGDYHYRHEPILYGWKDGAAHKWYGGRKNSTVYEERSVLTITQHEEFFELSFNDGVNLLTIKVPSYEILSDCDDSQTSIWKIKKPSRNDEHPTIKPVEISRRAIINSSIFKNVILDFFLGSGSTLIACEKTGRICYGMEIDPHYCDVIVKRWEDFTGKKAALES